MRSFPVVLSVIFTFCLFGTAGCGFISRNTVGLFSGSAERPEAQAKITTENAPETTSRVAVKGLEPETSAAPAAGGQGAAPAGVEKARAPADVEVIWEIPREPVEGFVVRYGFDREKLEYETKFSVAEAEKYDDSEHGFVYRYILHDIPPDKPLFVRIAAYDKNIVSELSPPWEAAPAKPEPE